MVARGLSCLLAGLMIGGITQSSASGSPAPSFDVQSLPQVEGLTTFSVTSSTNDKHCSSTSMDVVGTDKYIQVCGKTTASEGNGDNGGSDGDNGESEGEQGGSGDVENPGQESDGESGAERSEMNRAPQSLRKLTTEGDATESTTSTTSTLAPQANSYFQLINKSEFSMIKRIPATEADTIFKSVTSYDDTTILVSTAGSKTLTAYDATSLTEKTITLPTTVSPVSRDSTPAGLTLAMAKDPRSIAWDKAEKKLYATDGETNKIYVFDSTLTAGTDIEVACGKEGKKTTHLGDITYVKPYLYIAIEGRSNIIRVDTANGKCDTTWLIDFSTYQDASFPEKNKTITSFSMDKSVTEYTGTGFPKIMIAGDKWNHVYELSNASSYVVSSFVIFAITAITSIFSS